MPKSVKSYKEKKKIINPYSSSSSSSSSSSIYLQRTIEQSYIQLYQMKTKKTKNLNLYSVQRFAAGCQKKQLLSSWLPPNEIPNVNNK